MSSFYDVIGRFFTPYKAVMFALVLFIVFALVAYFVYTRYLSSFIKDKKYSDVANSSQRSEALQVFFFFADWCPHCKNAKPDWNSFRSQVDGTVVNGYVIQTVEVDCTNLDSDAEAAKLVKQNNVAGFPSVFAMKDNSRIDYDAKVELNSLNQFLDAITTTS